MLENHFFTALPAGENAIILSRHYREILLKNLLGYLISIQSALPDIDISFLIKRYENINLSKEFSPAIYARFSQLLNATVNGEVPTIVDAIHQLSILKDENVYDAQFRISTILTEGWESDFVSKIRTDTIPSEVDKKTIILPIINPDLSKYEKAFFAITEQIKFTDYEFYHEITNYVTRLKLFNGKGLTATTSSSVFGAIYLNIPRLNENIEIYLCEHIVHETSHLQLEILLAFDKLILNSETERYRSPLRKDPRPILGIFHAAFVLSRMVRLFKRIGKQAGKEHSKKSDIFLRQFSQGFETLQKNAVLTENGKRILNSLIKTAEL